MAFDVDEYIAGFKALAPAAQDAERQQVLKGLIDLFIGDLPDSTRKQARESNMMQAQFGEAYRKVFLRGYVASFLEALKLPAHADSLKLMNGLGIEPQKMAVHVANEIQRRCSD